MFKNLLWICTALDLKKELSGSLGVLRGKDDYGVVVEFDAWVLGFGTHCTVIQRRELRERVGKIGKELAERCKS
jgi:predicted DNA-binding transcriptional regulator YafY